jgi:hypothetical protein
MAQYGVVIGVGLLIVVTTCAYLLARKAARSVAEFREEHHESFVGRERP